MSRPGRVCQADRGSSHRDQLGRWAAVTSQSDTSLAFDVDSALLLELGERLVGRRSIALAELIKNSYDADASKVTVEFQNVHEPGGSIVVSDNGNGLTFDRFREGWMRIATTDSVRYPRSLRYARPRTGAKGVGRFATRRIAEKVTLDSVAVTKKGAREHLQAQFDWSLFKPGTDIQSIQIPVVREVAKRTAKTGVTLTLSGTRNPWSEADLQDLHEEIAALVSPSISQAVKRRRAGAEDPDPGIIIDLIIPDFPELSGDIGEQFLKAAWGTVQGSVDREGRPHYELDIAKNRLRVKFAPITETKYDTLHNVNFTIKFMVYASRLLSGSGFKVADAQEYGRKRGGVHVYYDGFQVASYGDPGDDWLELDQDRARRLGSTPLEFQQLAKGLERPMLLLPGNMQLFGAVHVTRSNNPELIVNISRDRFVETAAYRELRRFLRRGIEWMTVHYARDAAKTQRPKPQRQSPREALDRVSKLVEDSGGLSRDVKRSVQRAIGDVRRLIERQDEDRLNELSMLRVLASAGTTVLVLDHTLRLMVAELGQLANRLEELTKKPIGRVDQSELKETARNLATWKEMAAGQGSLVGLLASEKARQQRRRIVAGTQVQTIVDGFRTYITTFGINLTLRIDKALRTPPLFEAEFNALLLNLLTNAFKAVRSETIRDVEIRAFNESNLFVLRVSDSGSGMDLSQGDLAFEPFVTTSEADPFLGVGTGLGLKIVKDLVETNGGSVEFIAPPSPWRTSIEVRLPTES